MSKIFQVVDGFCQVVNDGCEYSGAFSFPEYSPNFAKIFVYNV